MKRENYIYITVFILTICLNACKKPLDIKPTGSIDQSQAILTAKDVQSTLVGTYNRMGQAGMYGGEIFLYSDLLATQTIINWTGTFQDLTQMVNQEMTNDNGFASTTWLEGYQVINQTNNVLANLKLVGADDVDRIEGEAKFIRGLTYFDLARLYGKAWNDGSPTTNLAVPIVLTPTTVVSDASYVPRATVAAVYAQAISDLTDAETKLPEDNTFYANKYSASAILARLYLQQGQYAKAVTEANKVIGSGVFALTATYDAEFPNGTDAAHFDNTTEDIFAIQVTSQQGTNAFNTFYASSGFGGRGDIRIKSSFTAGFEAADARGKFYTVTSVIRTKKYNNNFGNAHVVRLAEMYLIRAEGNLRSGTAIGATPRSDVNTIRARAGLAGKPATDFVPVGGVPNSLGIADILTERVHELSFEGFFLQDAKRLQQNVGSLPYNSPKLVFPVPLREIQANSKLVQNEGY
jgi:starch-binding outer membrane protein, SusD/RagB family